MQELISLLNEQTLYSFLLLLARILAFVVFLPIFNHTSISSSIRVAFAFFITIFLYPIVELKGDFTQEGFLLSLISEITLGFIAAMFLNVVFSAVRIIGDFVGYATALSMASMFDPSTGSNEGLVSRLLYWIALMIFFETGMYEMTIVILSKSFSIIHLGTFDIFSYDGIQIAIDEINRMFAFAFAFALPLFFIGFIMDLYYGYGTKSMPAFSPFVITFQLKFALIFIFLILGMDIFVDSFTNYLITKFQ
ncbi:flagellar biosynthetic protein FliR [Halarcobacter anaerophilus]|jgi:flagellar biosynthetic protein FliR|uniref:Flagellar biosynthesis protein FliR n=1 Tax=Halarcobacter anaerophilus TaxID=877500 RepID=A0A4Q0Y060_9BACT|nr:flagellar biosynthetic protein FliR [Halarcobacter anaerophilus]QDF29842.1 flagellar export apparatus, transmembrane gate complex, FliR component [Halarcobacter anaerophilus]RXJ62805.1 flagellar biosynthesis protein FliR [Halarcobacter anaerophilus]